MVKLWPSPGAASRRRIDFVRRLILQVRSGHPADSMRSKSGVARPRGPSARQGSCSASDFAECEFVFLSGQPITSAGREGISYSSVSRTGTAGLSYATGLIFRPLFPRARISVTACRTGCACDREAIVKRMAADQCGSRWSSGSVFSCSLPSGRRATHPMSTSTILSFVITGIFRRVTRTTLSSMGTPVIEAKSGEDDLRCCGRNSGTRLLVVNMPASGGWKPARKFATARCVHHHAHRPTRTDRCSRATPGR